MELLDALHRLHTLPMTIENIVLAVFFAVPCLMWFCGRNPASYKFMKTTTVELDAAIGATREPITVKEGVNQKT